SAAWRNRTSCSSPSAGRWRRRWPGLARESCGDLFRPKPRGGKQHRGAGQKTRHLPFGMVNAVGERVAGEEFAVQIVGQGLDEADLEAEPAVPNLASEG